MSAKLYTDADLVRALRHAASQVDGALTTAQMDMLVQPSPTTCASRWGSWPAAKAAAGVE